MMKKTGEMQGIKVVSPQVMRQIDRAAIEEFEIPGSLLMARAGQAVAEAVLDFYGREIPGRAVVLAGKGNNGGDALVAARHLHAAGWSERVFLFSRRSELSAAAADALAELEETGTPVEEAGAVGRREMTAALAAAELAVDGIFGTGFRGKMRGAAAEVVEDLISVDTPVVAIDIPSGVDGDSGEVSGPAVRAALTVTMGLPKPGLFRGEGLECAGRTLVIADLGFPPEVVARAPSRLGVINPTEVAGLFPPRPLLSHKNDFGHLLLLAGSVGMSGAAVLAARASLRAGVGLVTVGTPASVASQVATALPEAMVRPLPESAAGTLRSGAWERLAASRLRPTALAIGPGLGSDPESGKLVQELVADYPGPAVFDADALNHLASAPARLAAASGPRVLTPHPGEMVRLLGGRKFSRSEREEVARAFSAEHRVVLVLKGAGTLVASPSGRLLVNLSGNPGLATAGSGDVLTGMIGAFLAGGMEPFNAAAAAVHLHGLAADLAACRQPEASLIASDIVSTLPRALSSLGVT